MVYYPTALNPSQGQIMDLTSGNEVKLSPQHLKGNVTFSLTTAQKKKIEKALAAGRGCTLKFSAAQVRHHAKHGEGIIRDYANKGIEFVKPIVRQGIHAGLTAGRDWAQDKADNMLGLKPKNGKGFMSKLIRRGAHGMVDVIGDTLGGAARPANRYPPRALIQKPQPQLQQGDGFISSLFGAIGLGAGEAAVAPSQIRRKHGRGFLSKLARRAAHGAIDVIGDTLGGTANPNPMNNPNEQLHAALFQKKVKVPAQGQGLYLPGR